MTPVLECKFSCELCDIENALVWVPVRKEGQSVTEWMEKVCLPEISRAHALLSPFCQPATLTNVMIPMPEPGLGIGTAKK